MAETIFRRNPNLFKSFWHLQINLIRMFMPHYPWIPVILAILSILLFILFPFLVLPFIAETSTELLFLIRVYLIVLIFYPFSWFFPYLGLLKSSPIFRTVALRLNGESGFWVIDKGGKEEFVSYNNIDSMNYQPYIIGAIAASRLSRALTSTFIFSRHFLISYRNNIGEKKEVRIPLNISKVSEALDIIVNHIPEEKRGNVRVIKGRVAASIPGKSFLEVDLDKLGGKIVLIILSLIVIGIWLFMTFYLTFFSTN